VLLSSFRLSEVDFYRERGGGEGEKVEEEEENGIFNLLKF